MKIMYSLDEIGIVPANLSSINSRKDVNPFTAYGKLPVFVSPMTCLVDKTNIKEFSDAGFEPIMPVTNESLFTKVFSNWTGWKAFTLEEFKTTFVDDKFALSSPMQYNVLIDVANGHMQKIYEYVVAAKKKFPNLVVMIGNIANPETYIECCKARVDYVRIGIGGGSGCTTSVQTGIHTSIPWLLEEIGKYKTHIHNHEISASVGLYEYTDESIKAINGFRTKIVADGGVNTIAKAIKCLALGADYVMMGRCFAECEEGGIKGRRYIYSKDNPNDIEVHNLYYGQSSEEGQKDRFGKVKSNPEGSAIYVPVVTTLKKFSAKFEACLRSAMSYCGAKNLQEFIGKAEWTIMSPQEFNSFNK